MKTKLVPHYVANDGTHFTSESKCRKYESELDAVAAIVARIPDSGLKSGQYRQHDVEFLRQIKRDLWKVVLEKFGDTYPHWKEWDADIVHSHGPVCLVLLEWEGPVAHAWSKLTRFDFDLGREYADLEFVLHPEKTTVAVEELRATKA